MALIGTIRNKMTKWVIGAIALALGAFIVGSDLFGNGPRSVFGNQETYVGEIGGHNIYLEEFQRAIQERENNYILNFGRQAGEQEMNTLRQQAWELLISKYAIQPQYEKLGIQVTSDEVWDMIQGKNVDESVKSSFLNEAGTFDRAKLVTYLQQLDGMSSTDEPRVRWDYFKSSLVPGRERLKYENLLLKTNYVTTADLEREYHTQNDVVETEYLYAPFFAISDSSITVSDSDLKSYYDKNKAKYKAENTRSISYVGFPVVASVADSLAIREELNRITEEFKTTSEDSVFASINTDGQNAYSKYSRGSLPTFLSDQKDKLVAGTVIGPFLDGNIYKVVKVVKVGKDTLYDAKASHILIKWDADTEAGKKAAKEKARGILNDIKKGASFADKAREFGTDGSASRGGDLGYFSSGTMVKPFQDAVFAATKPGLLSDVVTTDFGYHIIDVTAVKDNTSYTVAMVEREIIPGDETQNEAYRLADVFVTDLSGIDDFNERAKKDNRAVFEANDIVSSERNIVNLGEARQIVTWLFRDGSVGKVSEVFDLDNKYVVAVMTAETDAGTKPFDLVKEEITPAVKNELKGKMIVEKLNAQKGTLQEIAAAFGKDASVNSSSDLKLNANSLPAIGMDPTAVGVAFSIESGKRSRPIAGENGVFIFEIKNKTTAPDLGDYSIYKNQALQTLYSRVSATIAEAIKDDADIDDKRYKFF